MSFTFIYKIGFHLQTKNKNIMNQQVKRNMAFASITEMRRKVNEYEKKEGANQAYIEKNRIYITQIEDYILELEDQNHNALFNPEFIIVTDQNNTDTRLKIAYDKIINLENILELKGVTKTDQAYLIQDSKEITRHLSFNKARETWPELY
jgi:hypothetical protein